MQDHVLSLRITCAPAVLQGRRPARLRTQVPLLQEQCTLLGPTEFVHRPWGFRARARLSRLASTALTPSGGQDYAPGIPSVTEITSVSYSIIVTDQAYYVAIRVEFASMFGISVKVKLKIISLNGRWFVATGPVSPDPGRDEDPAGRPGEPDVPEGWRELSPSREDWLTEDEWVAWLSRIEPEEWANAGEDPGEEPAGQGASTATGSRAAKNGRAARGSVRAAKGGRRGPGERNSPGQPSCKRRG